MKPLFIICFLVSTLDAVWAKDSRTITCHTPRMDRIFSFNDHAMELTSGRNVASLNSVRTRLTETGFIKNIQAGQLNYKITVGNLNKFSEFRDYVTIRDQSGHQITFPLTCFH